MTTTTEQLQDLISCLLIDRTDAGVNVFTPRTWSTWEEIHPCLLVEATLEQKTSLGTNAPEFEVVSTIRVIAETMTQAEADNYGARAARAAMWCLQRQIETAIINNEQLMPLISEFPSITSKIGDSKEGGHHYAQLVMDFTLKFYQGPEDFYQPDVFSIQEITTTIDATNVFDPNGTYDDPLFPDAASPAPRTTGPDGRVEAGTIIQFP
jgi:hypothetical protein